MFLRGVVEYDGTNFLGFQIQVHGPTIQGELEAALSRLTGQLVRVTGAGRTDAGVHAIGQVISFTGEWQHSLAELQRAMNALLPAGIAVRELAGAPEGFHPRFSAISRTYIYRVLNQPWRSPLAARTSHHVSRPLNVRAMQAAAQDLVGVHDFAAFGRPPQGENTIREVIAAEWRQQDCHLEFTIEANAFLQRMVRSIVGTLLQVGLGERPPDSIATLLQCGERAAAGPPAPACGLCLINVRYKCEPIALKQVRSSGTGS